jgi:hypothetical protein
MSRPKATLHPVTIHATKNASGDYQFAPESNIWDAARDELVFSKDQHGMHSHDHHLIEFVLDDQTGDGLKFPSTPHDGMWIAEGHDEPGKRTCPHSRTQSDYSVMEPISVSPDRKRLFVRNDNHKKEHWVFTMNFVKNGDDNDKSKLISWDPAANNQNGGSRR